MKTLILLVLVALTAINPILFSQTSRGSLTGLIHDQAGAAIAGANVKIKNIATGEDLAAPTNNQGAFDFPSLLPGTYQVNIEAAGFKRAEIVEVVIEVSKPSSIDLTMEVGAVSEEITVSSDVQQVINSTSATLTNVINPRQVQDLPLASRNPLDLAGLQAGVAVLGTDVRNASVAGLRGSGTNITQDGINALDNFVKTSGFFAIASPSLNSTSEFSVTVGTVGSDAGRGAAQVNIVTPLGTNQLHGSLFYQFRNDALNANSFFNNATGTEKVIERQNFFGFNVSGPVWLPKVYDGRDQSFWFFSYEGFREPFSVTRNRVVLTEQARQGIFRYTDTSGNTRSVNLLQIGNATALNPVTMEQINSTPLPNNNVVAGTDGLNTAGFRFNVPGSDPNDSYAIRIDQKLFESSRFGSHKLEFVLHRAKFLTEPDVGNNVEAPFPGGVNKFQSSTRTLATAAIQSTFGSNVSNELRYGHQRAPVEFPRESAVDDPFLINFATITDVQNRALSQGRNTLVYQFNDNLSFIKGTHIFRMGNETESISVISTNDAGSVPTINLGTNSANPSGITATDFPGLPAGAAGQNIVNAAINAFVNITGFLGSGNQTLNVTNPTSGFVPGATNERLFRQRETSFYFMDQWKARQNLTLTLGMRWEFIGVPTLPNGLGLQLTNFNDINGVSGPGNLFNPGVLGNSSSVPTLDFVSGNTGRPLYNNDWNNFAPFFGFAYSPNFKSGLLGRLLGSGGKSSIRGGYSISYLRDGLTVVSNALGFNAGLAQTVNNATPTGVLTQAGVALPVATFSTPITAAENLLLNSASVLSALDPNLRTPYVQQWSFGIEREIGSNTAFEVRYVGNRAVKLYRATNINEINIFENGFLNEFLSAQQNLERNGGTSFAPGSGGIPLPTLSTFFQGLPSSQGFTNTAFINNLLQNNVGGFANTLAFSPTYTTNRQLLPANFFVANPDAAFALIFSNASYSNYNSLQVEFRRRFSKGLQFQANYTFGKALTDSNGSQSNLQSFMTIRDPSLDYAPSDLDVRHRFVANFVYDLPIGSGRRFFANAPAVVGKLIEGWSLGSIINWQSRPPFYITSNRSTFNNALNETTIVSSPAQLTGISFEKFKENTGVFRTPAGVFYINPDLLDIVTDANGQLVSSRLKEGLIESPAPGTIGNFPINSLSGPSFFQADFSINKRFRFLERADVKFKLTLINAFNHANFVYNSEGFDDATFGLITAQSGNPRIIHAEIGINW